MLIRDGATLVRGPEDVIEAIGAPERAIPRATDDAAPALPLTAAPAPGTATAQTDAAALSRSAPERPRAETRALHQQILDRLGPTPLAEDQLIRDLSRPAQDVTPELVTLELEGRITRHPGGLLARTH
ncbi:MAG: hypothetical protein ACE368_17400 [Paracoccaceae bacterium]